MVFVFVHAQHTYAPHVGVPMEPERVGSVVRCSCMRSKVVNKEITSLLDWPEYRTNRALKLLVKMTRAEEVPEPGCIEIFLDPTRLNAEAEYVA